MDLLTLIIGIVIGLVIGLSIGWVWANSLAKTKSSLTQSTEAELKALLAEQAKHHLQTSRATIKSLERELATLLNSVTEYENTLTVPTEDFSKSTFFGEHASVFLRNTDKSQKPLLKTVEVVNTSDQPKDFASTGSGVFVGTTAAENNELVEKSNN